MISPEEGKIPIEAVDALSLTVYLLLLKHKARLKFETLLQDGFFLSHYYTIIDTVELLTNHCSQ